MADQTFDKEIASTDCAKAPLNSRWIFKLLVITLVVFVVGAWGLWDASSVYPKRGIRYADWAKWQYLEQAKKANAEDFGIFIRESSVTNPAEELERLSDTDTKARNIHDSANSSSSRNLRATMMITRYNWLDALKVVGQLDAEHTAIGSPQSELDAQKTKWQSADSVPKPLHTLDLIVQWMIMAVCWAIALYMFLHMLKVRSKKYAWEAASMKLTLPGGASITPADLEEVDKRKWDKFIVFLKIKSSHTKLGGKEIAVDTYQHNLIEDWILAMEEKAFGSQEDGDDAETSSD
ncbi:hypothetical protein COB72_08900 [bacterium]|nr:MAG: hypothetical protein COB72_08900 [bacterium]